MNVSYFGSASSLLFGAFDLPARFDDPPRGVVVCGPAGHEALRAHRALRQLALRLTAKGVATLRFDYFGCGDSAGECEEGEASRWLSDVEAALAELHVCARASRMGLVGLRLGAALAVLAGARRGDVDRLVLWEPVLEGSSYIAEQLSWHRAWLRARAEMAGSADMVDDGTEILGFPLTQTLRRSIESLNLFELTTRPAAQVLIVERARTAGADRLQQHLAELGAEVAHRVVAEPAIWLARPRDQAVVPPQTLETIVDWVGEDGR